MRNERASFVHGKMSILSFPVVLKMNFPRQLRFIILANAQMLFSNTMLSIFIHFHLYFPRLINNLHCVIQQFSFFFFAYMRVFLVH